MADIRQRVEEDRGILKTIQTFIPGFRGYRLREDLRDADKMLRMQLAKKLGMQRKQLEDCRGLITKTYNSKPLDLLGGLISSFKRVEGEVEHAEMGYSGFAADIQIKEDELNRLYEFDAGLIMDVNQMTASIESLKPALVASDDPNSILALNELKARIADFEMIFNRRISVIEGTEV